MFIFNKKTNDPLGNAKVIAATAIKLALLNNPDYKAGIAIFCGAASDPNGEIAKLVHEALTDYTQDPAVSIILADCLKMCGFFTFEEPEQLEILKEICQLVNP